MFEHKRSLGLLLDYLESEGHLDTPRRAQAEKSLGRGTGATGHWALAALQAAGAWLAAFSLVLFVGFAIGPNEESRLMMGACLLIGALVVGPRGEVPFLRQLARAVILLGQVLFVSGCERGLGIPEGYVPGAVAACAVVHALGADRVSRFLSTAFTIGLIATWTLWEHHELAWMVPALLGAAVTAYHTTDAPPALRPAACAAAVALPLVLWMQTWRSIGTGDLLVRLALAGALARAIGAARRGLDSTPHDRLAAGAAAMAALALFGPPGLLAAGLLLVLGHDRQDPVLLGIGGVSFPFWIAWFYYDLHLTLAAKAAALVTSGILLLAARLFVLEGGSR